VRQQGSGNPRNPLFPEVYGSPQYADNAERAIMQSDRAEVALWHAYQ
jgi:hypothetical protein